MPAPNAVPIATADDFKEPEKLTVALPRQVNGKTVAVVIRAVPLAAVLAALEGIPELESAEGDGKKSVSFNKARELILQQDKPTQKIAKLGLVEPVFKFDGDEESDAPAWANVHSENQQAIVNAITELAGLGGAKGEAAKAANEFRPVADQ